MPQSQSLYRVILVDDEEFVRNSMASLIPWRKYGIAIVEASANAAGALHYLETHDAELMITDVVMPVMDGLELIRRVREQKPDMEIIVTSGYADFSYCQKALRLGCRDYLLKPVDRNALLRAVEACRNGSPAGPEGLLPPGPGSGGADEMPGALPGRTAQEPHSTTVNKLLKIIDEEFDREELSLKWISANRMYLNEDYLGKLFSREVRQKFNTYLINYRITFAMRLLAQSTDLLITDVARRSGFGANSQYFASTFKKATGYTPTEYRRMITGKVPRQEAESVYSDRTQ